MDVFYHFREYTPDELTADFIKEKSAVFVFGSNTKGLHYGGAARFAHQELGAEMGKGFGFTSRYTYAIATLKSPNSVTPPGEDNRLPKREIRNQVIELMNVAAKSPDTTFYVTKIGLGIAGFELSEIVYAFTNVNIPDNVVLPWEIATFYDNETD